MSAAERTHSPAPEEVMAYLDGETTMMSRAEIEAHLAGCETCRAIAADLRGVSDQAKAWAVASAPASLHAPHVHRGRARLLPFTLWRPSRVAMAGLAAAAAILVMMSANVRPPLSSSAPRAVAETTIHKMPETIRPNAATALPPVPAPPSRYGTPAGAAAGAVAGVVGGVANESIALSAAQGQASAAARGPMVIRTATVRIVVKEFANVRATVESIVAQAGGFVDRLTVDGDPAAARSLSGSLRVPSDRMSGVLDRLRQVGHVVEDTQGSEDVTDQIVDLDARLANARATEQRLTDLLKNRTGRLTDVLSVEREIARVRLEIERLDAEKTNTTRRVAYATIEIQISEERKASLETGALPLTTRIRVAAADGAAAAIESLVGTVLLVLRTGPSLLFWGIVAALVWMMLRRRVSGWGFRSRASE
jgi:hypothetical protein